ncbi:MAG: MFS transporter [Porticoccaceae bacterium]|nr:MFS transporter [Porticoccaceae bacterium]
MSMTDSESQFHLLASKRFLPLFVTQFLGAFNDNLFKNTLIVLLVSAGASGQFDSNIMINLAAGLFVLPFFLLSPIAGQLADKYEKSALIRRVKFAEIVIMAIAVAVLYFQWWAGLLGVLFLMGVQSAFFGPLKFSILPQHLHPGELVAGNAQVEMGTFAAILTGTLLGTLIGGLEYYLPAMAVGVISIAVLGWLASRQIPPAEPHAADLQLNFNPFSEMKELVALAREKKAVWLSILGISWFWLLGAAYLTQTPNFAVTVLNGGVSLIALLLCTFTVGIGAGSLLCDRLSGHKVEIGLVPLGSIGLSGFGIDLYFAAQNYAIADASTLSLFFAGSGGVRILVDLLLLGLFGGLYVVPMTAMIQARTPVAKRARVIACGNIFNALFMVVASVLGALLLGLAGLEIPEFLLIIALANIAVAVFIYLQVPEFTMRFLVWLLGHSIYRVRHEGFEHIPERGAAVLVCNHVSFVDALIIGGAVRRAVRFVMYKPIYDLPLLNFIFRTAGAIPVCSRRESEAVYESAMKAVADALARGELVCIFPEGKLTRDGDIDEFRPGIEKIIAQTPVPVIPMALRGLWGSFFSHSGGVFRSKMRPFCRVDVAVAPAIAPEQVSAADLRVKVAELRGEMR